LDLPPRNCAALVLKPALVCAPEDKSAADGIKKPLRPSAGENAQAMVSLARFATAPARKSCPAGRSCN